MHPQSREDGLKGSALTEKNQLERKEQRMMGSLRGEGEAKPFVMLFKEKRSPGRMWAVSLPHEA
jgi:hypothetical protein